MKKRTGALLGAVMVLAMFGAPAQQAGADHTVSIQFVCKVRITAGSGIHIPDVPPTAGPDRDASIACGQNKPDKNTFCQISIVSLKMSKTSKPKPVGTSITSNCSINNVGPIKIKKSSLTGVGPYCGNSSGNGVLTILVKKTKKYTVVFTYDSAGTVLEVKGTIAKGGQQGSFESPVQAISPLDLVDGAGKQAGNSCSNTTDGTKKFVIRGAFVAALTGNK